MDDRVVYDQKWQILLRRATLFRYVPFVDCVIVAGSMALGSVKIDSDFDVIVGCRSGRIFTARFFCIALFSLFGSRRSQSMSRNLSSNRFCFNHFVTPERYQLSGPYNSYWQELYRALIPLYGHRDALLSFYESNHSWSECHFPIHEKRHLPCQPSYCTILCERVLLHCVGDYIEAIMGWAERKKIRRSFIRGSSFFYKPRFVVSDQELEFHMNTRRIETIIHGREGGCSER